MKEFDGPVLGLVSQNCGWSSNPPGDSVQHVLVTVPEHESGPVGEQLLEILLKRPGIIAA